MLENFFILHQTGECVFMNNYHGDPLPLHTILGLSSCLSMIVGATTKPDAGKEKDATGAPRDREQKDAGGSSSNSDPRGSSQPPSDSSAASAGGAAGASNVCSISVNSYKFVYLDHLPYTLVAQGTSEESDAFLSAHLYDVRDLITTYLGHGVVAQEDAQAIKGITDLIHHLLQKYATDLSYLCGGTRWVYLDDEVREQVDRLLGHLEEASANTGGASASGGALTAANQAAQGQPEITGTMLVLGGSVLHSRLANNTSKMLLHHLSCRPLGTCKLRTVPLLLEGVWRHYTFVRLRHLVLVCAIGIKAPLAKMLQLCLEFEEDLVDTNLNLPIEEPPVLLRHYTGHDTIAFLYHHHASGVTVAPPPRNTHSGVNAATQHATAAAASSTAGTPAAAASHVGIGAKATEALAQQAESAKTLQVFNWFYSRANQTLTKAYVSEVILHLKGYRFYAVHEDEFSLFILYSENVSVASLSSYNKEILENVLRHNGALIAE